MSQKRFTHLVGCGIKSIWSIFKTKVLIYQSNADLDEKIVCLAKSHIFNTQQLKNV